MIEQRFLPLNTFSRPGEIRAETHGIAMHWTGKAGQEAAATARYFELLAEQSQHDDSPDRYASAHAIIGTDGHIIQVMPWDEVAYHVGAKSYTSAARHRYPEYTTNRKRGTPNWALVGIELCHKDLMGRFAFATIVSAIWLCRYLLKHYTLGPPDIVRHFDVTGKDCPHRWVERPEEFDAFKENVYEALAEG